MKRVCRLLFLLMGLLLISQSVFAGVPSTETLTSLINDSILNSADSLLGKTVGWLSLFITLQFLLTNWKLLPSGDLDSVMAKFLGSFIWFGFCFYIMQTGPGFIKGVGNQFITLFMANVPTPGNILLAGSGLIMVMWTVAAAAMGSLVLGGIGQILMWVSFFVLFVTGVFALKVFLIGIELALIVGVAPMSFTLLGLNSLKDQGFSPLKSLLALIYRMFIMGVIFLAFIEVNEAVKTELDKYVGFTWDALFNAISGETLKGTVKAMGLAVSAYSLLLGLLWKSDSLASSLAGGSSSMNAGDMAGAVAAGVSAGMAAHAAGQAMMKPAMGVQDTMKGLFGKGGGVNMKNSSMDGSGPGQSSAIASEGSPSMGGSGGADSGGGDSGADLAPNPPKDLGPNPNNKSTSGAGSGGDGSAKAARQAARSGGSGKDAGISGNGNSNDEMLKKINEALGQGQKKGIGDRLMDANQHVEKERASTHVSINTHHE